MDVDSGMNGRIDGWKRAAALAAVLALGACATVQPPQSLHLQSADAAVRDCAEWFRDSDAAIDNAGVRDREAHRLGGFPYLRSTRFLAALLPAEGQGGLLSAWMERLRAADLQARTAELRNLDGDAADRQIDKARRCGERLMAQDAASADVRARIAAAAAVPQSYDDMLRVLGAYPLSRIPFAGGVAQWHAEAEGMFRKSREGVVPAHPVERYAPAAAAGYSRAEVAALFGRTADAFGVPGLEAAEESRLFATYAPVFEVETTGDYDRPGALRWSGAAHPLPDISVPAVYRRIAYTRYGGRTLVQLVYTIWFSERPADKAFDILAGGLDGLVWRVTLSPQGEPLVFDTMHPCGCYHMFFPTPLAEALPSPEPGDEWAFMPASLPKVGAGQRIRLHIATRSHYLTDVGVEADGVAAARGYGMRDENELRALPLPGGGSRSLYGADALVAGSERGERFLFWPMGIPSAGAMRQWGNHATAFLGKRHFDDADLIERRFRLQLH